MSYTSKGDQFADQFHEDAVHGDGSQVQLYKADGTPVYTAAYDADGNLVPSTSLFGGISLLNTKGDLLTYDTNAVRKGVGADGEILIADSSQTDGLLWEGTRMLWKGTWSSGVTYKVGDVVRHSGTMYLKHTAGSSGGGTPTFINAASNVLNSHSISLGSVVAGNLVVLFFADEGTVDPATVADNFGSTWTRVSSIITGQTHNASMYYAIANGTGTMTVTYTSGGAWYTAALLQASNVNASVNVVGTTYSGGGASPVQNALVTTAANVFIVAGIGGQHSANTYTAVSGFTLDSQANGHDAVAIGHRTTTTAGTYTVGFNITADSNDNQPLIACGFVTGIATPDTDSLHWYAF